MPSKGWTSQSEVDETNSIRLRTSTSASTATTTSTPASTLTSTSASGARQFRILKDCGQRYYDVTTLGGDHLFHVDISRFTSGKPDLTLHEGHSTASPVVGACFLPKASRRYKLGLGDIRRPLEMTWEAMDRIKLWKFNCRWSTDMLSSSTDQPWAKSRNLVWKRSSTVKMDSGVAPSSVWKNLKLEDEETGEIVAVFKRGPGVKIGGVLQINVDADRSFDLMVLLSRLSTIESARRAG